MRRRYRLCSQLCSWQCRRFAGSACCLPSRFAGSACCLPSRFSGSACHLPSRFSGSACRLPPRFAGSSARLPCRLTDSFACLPCRLRRHSFPPILFRCRYLLIQGAFSSKRFTRLCRRTWQVKPQQLRQLSNIHSNAPCLIEGQQPSDVSLVRCLTSVGVGEGLAIGASPSKLPGICSTCHGAGKRRGDVMGASLMAPPRAAEHITLASCTKVGGRLPL
jgi:hypothetical protein